MLRLALLAVTLTLASAELLGQWAVFKSEFKKRYSPQEEAKRRDIFEKRLQLIEQHNTKFANGESSYYMSVNQYADMTFEEIFTNLTTLRKQVEFSGFPEPKDVSGLPSEVNWVTEGYVTRVKNQGNCGSCWAFSATGALEGQHKKVTGELISVSESQLVDCSWDFGNKGCSGGYPDWAYDYIIDVNGIQDDESYPYVPKDCECVFDPTKIASTVARYKKVKMFDESDLQEKVAEYGPVSVCIDASDNFCMYGGGVFDDDECSMLHLNHAVLAAGYGHDDVSGKDYWLVKNSWGESFGENGYIRMSRNKQNQCGIATYGTCPLI